MPVRFTPTQAADRWIRGVTNSRQTYIDGVNRVQTNPADAAIAAQQDMITNWNEAINSGRWTDGLRRTTLQGWKDACINRGAERLTAGAQSARPRMVSFYQRLFPIIQQGIDAIDAMPKGTFEQRMARFRRYAETLHNAFRGQGNRQMPGAGQ